MTENEFLKIAWPKRFEVCYADGNSEFLLAEGGVLFSSSDDDPTGRGFISASIPAKSLTGNSPGGRIVYLDEIRQVLAMTGEILWTDSSA